MRKLLRNFHWVVAFSAIGVMTVYWSLFASDRYVSESNVVLDSPQISAPEISFGSIFGAATGGSSEDMLLLRDYLLSVDMMRIVDNRVGLLEHYSDGSIDRFSRLPKGNVPLEELHDYYWDILSVELDDYAQVLRIRVTAFTPEVAHKICELLIVSGESYINKLGQRLAEEQVRFLEKQVESLSQKFEEAKRTLVDYQNRNELASPTGTLENINALIGDLEGRLAATKAKRGVLMSYQSSTSPELKRVESEIEALSAQIHSERRRLAEQSGNALNVKSSEFQTLELKLRFAQESYSSALAALQNTRIEAARQLKQVSVLQSPTMPEYPMEPRRLYNIVVFSIIVLFLGMISHMILVIIGDHRD